MKDVEDSSLHAEKIINYTDTVVAFMSSSRILELDTDSPMTLEGVREKITNHPIFQNVAQY